MVHRIDLRSEEPVDRRTKLIATDGEREPGNALRQGESLRIVDVRAETTASPHSATMPRTMSMNRLLPDATSTVPRLTANPSSYRLIGLSQKQGGR
jgi:hypothetical protein